ncbi:hypothetical protein, partial [Seonamhaeicola sp.]|uniref:hypothetical protein n=1 Tax=Seonamhaeicola sp. TaxID=1912245 RepID=UPI00356534B8
MKNSDNKYYTPTIEEFYVGFEYETLCENGNVKDDSNWNKFIFGVYDNFEFDIEGWSDVLKEYISHKLIRAKHLDREDIKECNFQYSA